MKLTKPHYNNNRKLKIYDVRDPQHDAHAHWKLLCKKYSDEAHIKPKYVRYIIASFIKVVRDMVAEGYKVKLPGLGDIYVGPAKFNRRDYFARYSGLCKKYIFAGIKPRLTFKFSTMWKEEFQKLLIEEDMYINDPIAFDERPPRAKLFYYMDKNKVLKEKQKELGRTSRPMPMYTPEDIDRLCLELGIEYPEYTGPKYPRLTREQLIEAIEMYREFKGTVQEIIE